MKTSASIDSKIRNFLNKTRSLILLSTLLLIIQNIGLAQTASQYAYTASSGTYSALTGATTATFSGGTADEGYYNNIPIGFNFAFCGTTYTVAHISTNGWVTLGTASGNNTIGGALNTNNLSTSGKQPIFAPLWDDLSATNTASDVSYKLQGSSPNRTFTIQYNNIKWNFSAGGTVMNFQIVFYETTNAVSFIYNPGATALSSASASIGITSASGNYLSVNGVTTSATVSSSTETSNISTKPASGITYTFTPPTCFSPSGITSSAITTTSATISWTAGSPAPSNGYQYEVRTSGAGGSGSTGLAVSGNTAAGILSANISGLSPSTQYFVYVRSYCGGTDYSSWANVHSFYTTCGTGGLTHYQGFNSASIPNCWTQQYITGTSNITYLSSSTNPAIATPFEGSKYIYWDSYNYAANQETRLKSPPIATTGTNVVDVEFQWYHSNSGSLTTEGVYVEYSTDGTNWTTVGSIIPRYNATTGWALKTVTLPAGAGNQATLYVGFKFHSNYNYSCALDAVVIKPSVVTTLSATTLTAFGNICTSTTAGPNTFTLTGSNLSGNVTINALTGYTYSTTAGGAYTNTLTVTPSSGTINQVVYVKFTPTAVQSYDGNISISGGGATSINVAASGSGIGGTPSISVEPSNKMATEGAETVVFTTTVSNGISYQWQESTNGGSTWSNVSNGGVYS